MPEAGDDFERRLSTLLREWTEPAARSRSWDDEARDVIAEASVPARPSRFVLVTLGAAAAAGAVLLGGIVVILSTWRDVELPSPPGSSPSLSASVESTSSADPSVIPASELDLSQIAWWDQLHHDFGVVSTGPTPGPTVTIFPQGYRQVRIGTLDGRVTAMFAINPEWGHSYVSGPVDGEVLVVDDAGRDWSSIRSVDAGTGRTRYLHGSSDIITAAALTPGGAGFYYAKADRSTGADLGVWYKQLTPEAAEQQVDDAPEDFALLPNSVTVWNLAVSPDGVTLVSQFCFGGVRCTTHVIDRASGHMRESTAIGWPIGFTGRQLLGRRIGEALEYEIVALNLDTLEITTPEVWPIGEDAERAGEFGVELPAGWVADWPNNPSSDTLASGPPTAPVKLRNTVTGDEVTTPELTLTWPERCEPIVPSEMPSGGGVGPYVRTLEDGVRWARFGRGDDLVVQSMGLAPGARPGEPSTPVLVRGHEGILIHTIPPWWPPGLIGDQPFVGLPTIQWEEAGCWYRIQVPALTPEQMIEYAGRF